MKVTLALLHTAQEEIKP